MLHRILQAREAGDIIRFHTARVIRPETVGQHSFNVVNLILILTDGEASKSLILAALMHDMGEIATGDIPAPVKRLFTGDTLSEVRSMEDKAVQSMHPYLSGVDLSPEDEALLELCDRLDGLLKCMDELTMGNLHILPIAHRYCDYLLAMLDPRTTHYHEVMAILIEFNKEYAV